MMNSHWIILALLLGFAMAHSGLAALRPWGEARIGARTYRVCFALVSIPFASILILYFIRHRYDGIQLWNLQDVPGLETIVFSLSAISFLFLYPATFNLLEIAAIQKPEIHLYETGIIRITREAFLRVKARTSVIPFLAIFHGRQTIVWQEFLKPAYGGVIAFVLLFWSIHPWLMSL